jgi:hypothetical protein
MLLYHTRFKGYCETFKELGCDLDCNYVINTEGSDNDTDISSGFTIMKSISIIIVGVCIAIVL